MTLLRPAILLALLAAAGCTSDNGLRFDGVTPGAGDAIRTNTLLQVVDLSPPGAANTNLRVPARREPALATPDAGAPADAGAANASGEN